MSDQDKVRFSPQNTPTIFFESTSGASTDGVIAKILLTDNKLKMKADENGRRTVVVPVAELTCSLPALVLFNEWLTGYLEHLRDKGIYQYNKTNKDDLGTEPNSIG